MRRLFPALQHSGFARLWLASSISNLGSAMTGIALPLLAWHLTGSATAFASVFAAEGIGMILAGTFGGVLVDRFDRRRMMLAGDVIEIALLATLMPVVAHGVWAPIPIIAFLMQVTCSTFSAAGPALRRDLLPDGHRQSGNALTQLSLQMSNLAAPLVGAAFYQQWGMRPILLVDGLTYVVSIALVLGLRHASTTPVRDTTIPSALGPALLMFRDDVREGIDSIRADRVLTRSLCVLLAISVGNGALLASIVPWIAHVLHEAPSMFGVFISVLGASGLTSALILARIGDRVTPVRLMQLMILPAAVGACILPIASPVALLGCAAAFGFVNVAFNIASTTVSQSRLSSEMQGRFGAVFMLASQAPQLTALMILGPLVDLYGAAPVIAIVPVGILLGMAMQLRVIAELRREASASGGQAAAELFPVRG